MSEGTNGIAKPEDFRNFAEASAWAEGERIMLPKSGLAVRVRRPTIMYFKLRRNILAGRIDCQARRSLRRRQAGIHRRRAFVRDP